MAISHDHYKQLSKTIAHALRHEPWVYELELDDEGWVPLPQLLRSLRQEVQDWSELDEQDVEQMIAESAKRRYEIRDGHIRAIYGHSLPGKLTRTRATPPEILFHGTSPRVLDAIAAQGLKPMARQFVHLSIDEPTALEVGRRKAKQPVLLRVRALAASTSGVAFYEGHDKVWLADEVPPQFIDFPEA